MSGRRALGTRERELDGIADGQLVDAHNGVRAGRGFDVVVVRLVLEAVEAQVLETVGRAADVERGAEVVEADVGLGLGAVRVAQDLVRQESPYRRGNRYETATDSDGPRALHPGRRGRSAARGGVPAADERDPATPRTTPTVASDVSFDDFGATLHVCGTIDGLEHLRFDCFENEPHYHYIDQAAGANVVVRIDEFAVGDPVEFSLACVAHHLPDMLRNCGGAGFADEVAAQPDRVHSRGRRGRELMTQARYAPSQQFVVRRGVAPGARRA